VLETAAADADERADALVSLYTAFRSLHLPDAARQYIGRLADLNRYASRAAETAVALVMSVDGIAASRATVRSHHSIGDEPVANGMLDSVPL
jgi:hypothetical protein